MKKRSSAAKAKKTVTVRSKRIKDLDVKKKIAGGAAKAVKFAP